MWYDDIHPYILTLVYKYTYVSIYIRYILISILIYLYPYILPSLYTYKHNELHLCIKVKRAILNNSNLWICKFVPCNQIAYFKSFSYLSRFQESKKVLSTTRSKSTLFSKWYSLTFAGTENHHQWKKLCCFITCYFQSPVVYLTQTRQITQITNTTETLWLGR